MLRPLCIIREKPDLIGLFQFVFSTSLLGLDQFVIRSLCVYYNFLDILSNKFLKFSTYYNLIQNIFFGYTSEQIKFDLDLCL